MARYIAVVLILLGLALGIRGFYVWTGCGYDCPALLYPSLTATGAIVLSLLAGAGGLAVLLASLLRSLFKGR